MYIQSFHMDGFGIFSDVTVEGLSPALCIFLGANEAGKSTCLEFLRTMLTGWPAPRSTEARLVPAPLRGGQAGGGMTLCTEQAGILRLTRRPGAGGGSLSLTDESGKALEPDLLRRMLSGVSREVYRKVFGFSLSELEDLNSLTGEGVRNALYGASFGPGLRSPGEALKLLDKQNEEIFKHGGSKPPLNQALKQLTELRQRKAALEQECAGYDGLAHTLAQKQAHLADARQRKRALEAERRLLERRLGVWLQWNQWRRAGAALERLPQLEPTFPENGPARLAVAQEAHASCRRHLGARQDKLDRLLQRRAAIVVNAPLLEALPALRRLTERKSGFCQARAALPAQEDALGRARADLALELARLGPDWTCERIRGTDRSLFTHEELEKQAREMQAALAAHEAATGSLSRAQGRAAEAQGGAAAAEAALALVPPPPDTLDSAARDHVRQTLARREEADRQRPARRHALQEAEAAFARACAPLRLGPHSDPEDAQQHLDTLLTRQSEALDLAAKAQEKTRLAEEAARAALQAEAQATALTARMDLLRAQEQATHAPDARTLAARAAALRTLRALADNLARERERLDEAQQQHSSGEAPSPDKNNLPLLTAGLLAGAAGAAMLLASQVWGVTSLALAPGLELELNLWSGGLALFCGLALLAGSLPRHRAEALRRKQEVARRHDRQAACAARVAALEDQVRQCRQTAQVQSTDTPHLEAAENLLEDQRQLRFQAEALRRDREELKPQADEARARAEGCAARCEEARDAARQALERWQEYMQALRVGAVPAPEDAAAFFARAESARLALGGVAAAKAELHALNHVLRQGEETLRSLPAVAGRLAAGADDEALAQAARQTLAACREADAARERRARAEAALQNARHEEQRTSEHSDEARAEEERTGERLRAARDQWARSLQALGLSPDLTPETVRQAFKCMDACLAAQAAVERVQAELTQSRAEVAALSRPLENLLAGLHRPPLLRSDGEPDWPASLDAALEAAEATAQALACRQNLEREAEEVEDELSAAQAALESARAAEHKLLALAGARDAEDFLRQAALHEELRALTLRRQDLEDALRLAAGQTPLPEFLASFEREDQESQERRCAAINEELTALQEREENLVKEVSGLRHKVEALARTDELSHVLQQEASLVADMEDMAFEWSRRALARAILEAAKRTFERERQPEVIRLASDIFARITDQRWRGINASLEDPSLSILPAQGEALAPENLSRGAREQAYLALRLAYIRNHAAHAAPLPVIMDEVLVNFDPQRAESAARAFAELTVQGPGKAHQVLYFTCQPHMAEMLLKVAPQAALFYVEDGGIRAA